MKFVKMLDLGSAPEFGIDGMGAIELVTPNIIRCQYYTTHEASPGDCRNRLVVSLRWDTTQWLATWSKMASMGPGRLLDALPILKVGQSPPNLRTN